MSDISQLPASMPWPNCLLNNAEASGPYTFRRDSTTRSDVLTFKVPFEDLEAFLTVVHDQFETFGTLTRIVPLRHPWRDGLYAIGSSGRGVSGGPEDMISGTKPFKYVLVAVEFGLLPYSTVDRPFVSFRRSGKASAITLPNYAYKIRGTTRTIDQDVGVPCFQEDFVVTWHECTAIDAALAVLEPLAGCTNTDPVVLGARTYGVDELHFPEFDAEEVISITGARKASLSFPVRWRKRPTWQEVLDEDGTFKTLDPYVLPRADLNPLFEGIY